MYAHGIRKFARERRGLQYVWAWTPAPLPLSYVLGLCPVLKRSFMNWLF